MNAQEQIQAEIKSLNPVELQELFDWIQQFMEETRQSKSEGILSRLAQIQIDGPKDLSINHDLYVTGEKRANADTH